MERWPGDSKHVRLAAERLRQGAVIAIPTDTVYGVVARAADEKAVASLYRVKRRPSSQPLIWLVRGAEQLQGFAVMTPRARTLIDRYWPGPLTLVLPAEAGLGSPTLAARAPDHPVALELLEELGEALASSSANRAGEPPPLDADAVIAGLGNEIEIVLDAGTCRIGAPSTILDLSQAEPRILRQGTLVIPGIALSPAPEA